MSSLRTSADLHAYTKDNDKGEVDIGDVVKLKVQVLREQYIRIANLFRYVVLTKLHLSELEPTKRNGEQEDRN